MLQLKVFEFRFVQLLQQKHILVYDMADILSLILLPLLNQRMFLDIAVLFAVSSCPFPVNEERKLQQSKAKQNFRGKGQISSETKVQSIREPIIA